MWSAIQFFLLFQTLWALKAIVLACSSTNYCFAQLSLLSLHTVLCVLASERKEKNANRYSSIGLKEGAQLLSSHSVF